MMNNKTVRDKRVAFRKIDGNLFLVSPWDHMLHKFNETGTFMWELLEQGLSEKEITQKVADVFDVSPADARKDFNEFFENLKKKKIITSKTE